MRIQNKGRSISRPLLRKSSYGNGSRDVRPRAVAFEAEVLVAEGEDVLDVGVNHYARKMARCPRQLQARLVEMVQVKVCVACRMHEVAGAQSAHLRHHLEQQGVAGDVERHAKEGVRRALVELERETAFGHVELEEQVAGRQVHFLQFGHVPRRDDEAARIRIPPDLVHDVRNLVDVSAGIVRPRAPLAAVDRP